MKRARYIKGAVVNNFPILDVEKRNGRIFVKTTCPICNKEFWCRSDSIKKRSSCGCSRQKTQFKINDELIYKQ